MGKMAGVKKHVRRNKKKYIGAGIGAAALGAGSAALRYKFGKGATGRAARLAGGYIKSGAKRVGGLFKRGKK